MQSLAARGEQSDDVLMNLFKAYRIVQDEDFTTFIALKEQQYDDGELAQIQRTTSQRCNGSPASVDPPCSKTKTKRQGSYNRQVFYRHSSVSQGGNGPCSI